MNLYPDIQCVTVMYEITQSKDLIHFFLLLLQLPTSTGESTGVKSNDTGLKHCFDKSESHPQIELGV